MREYIVKVRGLAISKTAKDTYILFSGNLLSAFLGFVFTLLVARSISVEEFGILSAALNLVIIISSLTDLGISSGVVNFVSYFVARGKENTAQKYTKAAFVTRILTVSFFVVALFLFAPFIARTLLATQDKAVAYWAAAISFGIFFSMFIPFVLQARKRFLASIIVDNSLYFTRLLATVAFLVFGSLTMGAALGSYFFGTVVSIFVGFFYIGLSFLRTRPDIFQNTKVFGVAWSK
jgi:O-antigen/teichoic acid export membrane protein